MLVAWPMSATKNPDREFAYGAGHIDPARAVNPGLVFEALEGDYVKMLCDIGYDSKRIRYIARGNSSCAEGKRGAAKDLNYPSMAAYVYSKRPFNIKFQRTVTNVGISKSTYKVKIAREPGINVNVNPKVLSFKSLGEKKSFVVRVVGRGLPVGSIVSGSSVWYDGTHSVRSPIVVHTIRT
ncbi:hypothetical protein U1Q18_041755 [Sarracenia purpurea var. burkii]